MSTPETVAKEAAVLEAGVKPAAATAPPPDTTQKPPVAPEATCEICKKVFTPKGGEHVCEKCHAAFNAKKSWLEFFSELVPWLIIILPLAADALFGQINPEFFMRVLVSSFIATVVIYLKRRFSTQEGEAEKKVVELQNELDKEKLRNTFIVSAKENAEEQLAKLRK